MNAAPLHIEAASFCEVIVDTGSTTTLTVKILPWQLVPPVLVTGVTVYVAVATAAVVLVLVSVAVRLDWPAAAAAAPVMFVVVPTDHA